MQGFGCLRIAARIDDRNQGVPLVQSDFDLSHLSKYMVADTEVPHRAAGVLSNGDTLALTAGAQGASLLLLAGRPLNEPVVQHGPFVMNTREEIEQAMRDYRDGRFAETA